MVTVRDGTCVGIRLEPSLDVLCVPAMAAALAGYPETLDCVATQGAIGEPTGALGTGRARRFLFALACVACQVDARSRMGDGPHLGDRGEENELGGPMPEPHLAQQVEQGPAPPLVLLGVDQGDERLVRGKKSDCTYR